jgi:hypothetical protein
MSYPMAARKDSSNASPTGPASTAPRLAHPVERQPARGPLRATEVRLDREGLPLSPALLASFRSRTLPGSRRWAGRTDRGPSCSSPRGDGSSGAWPDRDSGPAPPRPPEAFQEVPGPLLPRFHQERPQALPRSLFSIPGRLPGSRGEPESRRPDRSLFPSAFRPMFQRSGSLSRSLDTPSFP